MFDYGYDSGCDWDEEEEDGEDLDDSDSPQRKKAKTHGAGSTAGNGAGGSMWDTDEEDDSFDEDDEDGSEDGSEDGWMVDEDEAQDPDRKRSESPSLGSKPAGVNEVTVLSARKGKGKGKDKIGGKRKKADAAAKTLVPVVKGPFFEETLGVCGWDGFEGYKIQLLNGM